MADLVVYLLACQAGEMMAETDRTPGEKHYSSMTAKDEAYMLEVYENERQYYVPDVIVMEALDLTLVGLYTHTHCMHQVKLTTMRFFPRSPTMTAVARTSGNK